MAITSWPRFSRLESPSGAAGKCHRLVDPQQREIGIGIVADHARGQILAVRGRHFDAVAGTGHVTVGEDEPIRRHDDA